MWVTQEMIIEEVQMFPWQAFDFCQGAVHFQRIKRFSAFEEGLLVTKVADMGATARHHNRVRHQIEIALDQIASREWQAGQGTDLGNIFLLRTFCSILLKKYGPDIFA